jgi:hypothetical protein
VPVRKAQREQIGPSLRFYLFRTREAPTVIGHNPLAGATYTVVFAMLTVEAVTGLALHSMSRPGGWEDSLTGWVFAVLPAGLVRFVHRGGRVPGRPAGPMPPLRRYRARPQGSARDGHRRLDLRLDLRTAVRPVAGCGSALSRVGARSL